MVTLHISTPVTEEGRLHCPARNREVELAVCAHCAWMKGTEEEAGAQYMRCAIPGYLGREGPLPP